MGWGHEIISHPLKRKSTETQYDLVLRSHGDPILGQSEDPGLILASL